jgi:protein gp37
VIIWNPWHGCHKISEGCLHCYMYCLDAKRGIDTSRVFRTKNFGMPLARGRNGAFRIPAGMELFVGLSTDFFVEEADAWRPEAWNVIRRRPDVAFRILTKRAARIRDHLPPDWGDGWENVMLQVTTENQARTDERLPLLLSLPAKHLGFMAAPLIGPVDASPYLASGRIEQVLCGGENYDGARPCRHEWVASLSAQCRRCGVQFDFIETGTVFVKDGKTYRIPDKRAQSRQAFLSGLSVRGRPVRFNLRHPGNTLFDEPVVPRTAPFRDACSTCGSRMTCNGCSNCGACDAPSPPGP